MFTRLFWTKVALSFARAFVPIFVLGALPVWDAIVEGDWNAGKAAAIAAASGGVTAGFRVVQALFTQLETPDELKGGPPAGSG